MVGAKAPSSITASGSPSEPALENAVTTINTIFKSYSPDWSTLTPTDIAALNKAYKDISDYVAIAKVLHDQKKIDIAEHWMKQLNLPRSDSASKLVFLEGRLDNLGSPTNARASSLFAGMIQFGINKLSDGAQQAKATRPV